MEQSPLQLSFLYSIDDLREGLGAKRSIGQRIYVFAGMLGWVILLFVLIGGVNFSGGVPRNRSLISLPVPPELDDLWLTLIPSALPVVVYFVFTLVLLIAGNSAGGTDRTAPAARRLRTLVKIIGYLGGVGIWAAIWVLTHPELRLPWSPTRGKIVAVSFTPWVLLTIWLPVLSQLRIRRKLKWMWNHMPQLRSQNIVEIADEGITAMDSLTSARYRWESFSRYSETTNLLRLHLIDQRTILLPKRAVSESEMLRCKALISSNIREGKFTHQQPGFGVVQTQPAIPLATEIRS